MAYLIMNTTEISKRKLESYKRAEKVSRLIRYNMQGNHDKFDGEIFDLVLSWMKVTGKIKFERP